MSEEDKGAAPTAEKTIPQADIKKTQAAIAALASAVKPTSKRTAIAKKAPAKKKAAKGAGSKRAAVKNSKAVISGTPGGAPKRTFPQYGLEDCYKLAYAIREFNAGNHTHR